MWGIQLVKLKLYMSYEKKIGKSMKLFDKSLINSYRYNCSNMKICIMIAWIGQEELSKITVVREKRQLTFMDHIIRKCKIKANYVEGRNVAKETKGIKDY